MGQRDLWTGSQPEAKLGMASRAERPANGPRIITSPFRNSLFVTLS